MKKSDKTDNVPTTGHEWDGIQEFDNPMPKWWLYTFYACIIWGIGYAIAMPAWPLISSATPGVLGYSTRQNAHAEIAAQELANAGINTQLENTDLISISQDRELMSYAKNAGASVSEHGAHSAMVLAQLVCRPMVIQICWMTIGYGVGMKMRFIKRLRMACATILMRMRDFQKCQILVKS